MPVQEIVPPGSGTVLGDVVDTLAAGRAKIAELIYTDFEVGENTLANEGVEAPPIERLGSANGNWYFQNNWTTDYDQTIFVGKADELPWAGRRATIFQTGWRREYVRRFRVIVNRPDVSPVEIGYCPGLPLPWSPFYPDPTFAMPDLLALAHMMTAEVEHGDDWQSWIVTVYYSTDIPAEGPHMDQDGNLIWNVLGNQPNGPQNQPWLERPVIKWDEQTVQVAPYRDLDGKYFLNAARQPFSPAPAFDVSCPVLVIQRNEKAFDRKIASKYAYALNSDVFLDAKVGLAQCLPIRAEHQFRGSQGYWRVEIRIRFAPTDQLPEDDTDDPNGNIFTWQPRILNSGTMQLNKIPDDLALTEGELPPDLNQPVPIFAHGVAVSHPVLLDANGRRKLPETAGPNIGKIVPEFINFRLRRAIQFANLITTGLSSSP